MISLQQIAEIVDGVVLGNGDYPIRFIHSLEHASRDSITFFGDRKKKQQLQNTQAGAVLISHEHADLYTGNKVIVTDPCLAHARISRLFKRYPCHQQVGVDDTARLASGTKLGNDLSIGRYVTIGQGVTLGDRVLIGNGVHIGEDVEIGDDTVIEDQVVICSGCRIGKRCCLSPAAVIGASGFGYARNQERWEKIEQLGAVLIGDDVDIGANTTIDRGTLDDTRIGDGVKLDNQILIAHNVQVGDNTIMAGGVGIAGSTEIGQRCQFAARVGILGHLKIADDVIVLSNSLVTHSIKTAGEYASTIAVQPAQQWRKTAALIRRLDKLVTKVKKLDM